MKFGDLRAQMDCLLASAMLESFPRDARWAGFQELNLPSDSLLSSSLLPSPTLSYLVLPFFPFQLCKIIPGKRMSRGNTVAQKFTWKPAFEGVLHFISPGDRSLTYFTLARDTKMSR